MRTLSIFILAAAVSATACERSPAADDAPVTAAKPAAAKAATTPSAAKPAASETMPAKGSEQSEGESCAGKMKEGGSCAGGCDQWNEAANDVLRRDLPGDASWTTVAVEGMTCGGCERRIIANVGSVDGVLKVEADAETGEVRIASNNGAPVTSAVEKIRSLGYRVVE